MIQAMSRSNADFCKILINSQKAGQAQPIKQATRLARKKHW